MDLMKRHFALCIGQVSNTKGVVCPKRVRTVFVENNSFDYRWFGNIWILEEMNMKLIKLLFEVRTNGIKILLKNDYSRMEKMIIVAVFLHLLSRGKLAVKEIKENGAVISVFVATEEIIDSCNCGNYEIKLYENKNSDIEELFSRLRFDDTYIEYKNKWTVPSCGGYRGDIDNEKKAKEFLSLIQPVVDENGHLLLAEDSVGNTVWAYVLRHRNSGSISYGIYKRDCNGRPSKTECISPAVVGEMGTRVGNIVKNYEGRFNSKDAIDATMKLWCWNMIKNFEIQNEVDDYDQQDIFESLKKWIIENAGKSFKKGDEKIMPVYFNELKDHTDIGIWSDSLDFVFKELEIEEKPKSWLREAVKEQWILPQLKEDGSFARVATNTSSFQREAFHRKNRNERFYRFSLKDEEIKMTVDNFYINKSDSESNQLVCDLDKGV